MKISIPVQLSPSKVDTFLGCRRLFKYRYLNPPPLPFKENKYFLIGNIAHKALELFFERYSEDLSADNTKTLMKNCFKTSVGRYKGLKKVDQGVIQRSDLLMIKDMMKQYLRYIAKKGAPKVVSIEQMAKFTIGDNVAVAMKADRLDKFGEAYRVVDYKTSARPSTRAQERASVQIPTYGLWVKNAIDADAPVYGEYQYLRHMKSRKGIHTFEITDDMIEYAEGEYRSVAKKLLDGCVFPQNFKYRYCRICDYRQYCLEDDNDEL